MGDPHSHEWLRAEQAKLGLVMQACDMPPTHPDGILDLEP